MSQSGVPGVSQIAQSTVNIANSVSDIAKGKNVFESLGRIAVEPFTLPSAIGNAATFHLGENVPIAGDTLKSIDKYEANPYSKSNAFNLAKSSAVLGASVGGAALAGPLLAEGLGVSSTIGAGLGGVAANKLVKGDLKGAADTLGNGLLNSSGLSDYTDQFNSIKGYLNSAASKPSNVSPVNNVNPASQTYAPQINSGSSNVLIVAVIVLAGVLVMKKKGLIKI